MQIKKKTKIILFYIGKNKNIKINIDLILLKKFKQLFKMFLGVE